MSSGQANLCPTAAISGVWNQKRIVGATIGPTSTSFHPINVAHEAVGDAIAMEIVDRLHFIEAKSVVTRDSSIIIT